MLRPYTYATNSVENARLQKALNVAGFDAGPADGDFGPLTRNAVMAAQTKLGIVADGVVRDDLLVFLGLKAEPQPRSNPITDYLKGLAIQAALNQVKGLPIVTFLSGFKTYIVGGLMVLLGVATVLGFQIPGVPVGDGAKLVMDGFAFIFLRGGVAKALGQ